MSNDNLMFGCADHAERRRPVQSITPGPRRRLNAVHSREAELTAYIERAVAEAPELSDAQRARLTVLLAPRVAA